MKNIIFSLITHLSSQAEFEGEKQYTVGNLKSSLHILSCKDEPDIFV